MLEDRDYMREQPRHSISLPPLSVWMVILALNTIVFLVQVTGGPEVFRKMFTYGALSLDGLKHGYVWQLLTFQFMHGSIAHFLFNSITLYFCGRVMEYSLGKRSFLALYLISGLVGGLTQVLLGLVSERFGGPVVGASAGLCGLLATFALMNPNSTITLFFILPLRAIYFLPLMIAISVAFMLFPAKGDNIAHAAHLGGTLIGVAWIKLNWHRFFGQLPGEGFLDGLRFWKPFQSRQRKRQLVRAASVRSRPWRTAPAESSAELPQEEFISKEVDPILDKISAQGIQSLTENERKILEAARKRMKNR